MMPFDQQTRVTNIAPKRFVAIMFRNPIPKFIHVDGINCNVLSTCGLFGNERVTTAPRYLNINNMRMIDMSSEWPAKVT
jgi:hypothetical protein